MSLPEKTSIYDRLRKHLDSLDLIRRLGLEHVRTLGAEAYCRPLCHESTSGESLQVNLHTGRWNCKACQGAGMRGDLIQLVEYVLTNGNAPTHGDLQKESASHREAVRWLCEQFGEPFDVNSTGRGDGALDVIHVFAMRAHEHLLESPDVLDWIQDKWGFDRETVEAYGIGYMPPELLPDIAREAARHQSMGAFKCSGIGWYTDTIFRTRFAGRVLFPYLEYGRAVYLIGRATPWTPDPEPGRKPPKYHKLSVHSETRPWISESVSNDHLYNEPAMKGVREIGVLEGVADAVAVSALGVRAVSPVTISFNTTDLERFLRKCRDQGIPRAWVLFDNELSGSGNYAARRTGRKLVEGGLDVRIVTLPLGPAQKAARDEVLGELGVETFKSLERANPIERKDILAQSVFNESKRKWISDQIAQSKIDGAEWVAMEGAAAAVKFDKLRKNAKSVIELEAAEVVVDPDEHPIVRADAFNEVVTLVAHIGDRMAREAYGSTIAKLAGKGVTSVAIKQRISHARRDVVKPKRKAAEEKQKEIETKIDPADFIIPPPESSGPIEQPPQLPRTEPVDPNAAPAPQLPNQRSSDDRYEQTRKAVEKMINGKVGHETIGRYVADVITKSMGYMPFSVRETGIILVRQNEKIHVHQRNAEWKSLLYRSSGLNAGSQRHSEYVAGLEYHLSQGAPKADHVSWSQVVGDAIYFPMADGDGTLACVTPGNVSLTRIADARIPAVQTPGFKPLKYDKEGGGFAAAFELFGWVSLSENDRMLLLHWISCFPLMHKIRNIPIFRIEGGSSSGKTRAVDAVSFLVNGSGTKDVPTAPALTSKLSQQMLTIDDNRESIDIDRNLLQTLLQAPQLGARSKRKGKSDTEIVVEHFRGALLMNGIEPIHGGASELVSRMVTLRADSIYREAGSPASPGALHDRLIDVRNAFWSDSLRRCSVVLQMLESHGEMIGQQIIGIFGATRIGRQSVYLSAMYFSWVAGLPEEQRQQALERVSETWVKALTHIADSSLESLVHEELAVTAIKYAFSNRQALATSEPGTDFITSKFFKGDIVTGEQILGPMRLTKISKYARHGAQVLNGPRSIRVDLSAGQLVARILDGQEFLKAANIGVEITYTNTGIPRGTFARIVKTGSNQIDSNGASDSPADSWKGGY